MKLGGWGAVSHSELDGICGGNCDEGTAASPSTGGRLAISHRTGVFDRILDFNLMNANGRLDGGREPARPPSVAGV